VLPADDRGLALGAGHSIGVTVAGLSLLAVVARTTGPGALTGVARSGLAALAGAGLGAAAGLVTARALDADPVPQSGVLAAVGVGLLVGGIVLVIALTVMMGTARGPLTAAVQALRAPERQEVHGG
jgi:putative peptidoglycan lipid II flippase